MITARRARQRAEAFAQRVVLRLPRRQDMHELQPWAIAGNGHAPKVAQALGLAARVRPFSHGMESAGLTARESQPIAKA